MPALSDHIGKRIKLYRKNKHMTQSEFARVINKSKSAVSKYECGEISIDIETLYEIADVLEISIHQLLDFDTKKDYQIPGVQGFFSAPTHFYVYYLNRGQTNLCRGVLEINRTDEDIYSTVFFADVKDYKNLYSCDHLYFGDIHYSDSYVNMIMENQSNRTERLFINIANPFNNNATLTVGMVCGISDKYLVPVALKGIFSKSRLPEDAALNEALRISKDDFSSMKKICCFTIDRLVEL